MNLALGAYDETLGPSVERTFQRLLRTLWLAAHVERPTRTKAQSDA